MFRGENQPPQVHDPGIDEDVVNAGLPGFGGGEAENIAAAQPGRADAVVAPGQAMELILPGYLLVGQEGSGDAVFPGGFHAGAAHGGTGQVQFRGKVVLNIDPDQGDNFVVSQGNGVFQGVADKGPIAGEAAPMVHFAKGEAVPELG